MKNLLVSAFKFIAGTRDPHEPSGAHEAPGRLKKSDRGLDDLGINESFVANRHSVSIATGIEM